MQIRVGGGGKKMASSALSTRLPVVCVAQQRHRETGRELELAATLHPGHQCCMSKPVNRLRKIGPRRILPWQELRNFSHGTAQESP